MLKLIIEQNIQINKIEEQIETLLKEKEHSKQVYIAPIKTILIKVAGTVEESTSETTESTSTTSDLNKLIHELSLQRQENEKLQKKFKNLETQKMKNDTLYLEEMQKTHRLTKKIQELQDESLMAQTLAQAKENIWADISQAITEVWPFIQIIF